MVGGYDGVEACSMGWVSDGEVLQALVKLRSGCVNKSEGNLTAKHGTWTDSLWMRVVQ